MKKETRGRREREEEEEKGYRGEEHTEAHSRENARKQIERTRRAELELN
jgi:hypothetical protein